MKMQFALKLLLATSVAACCISSANAQIVGEEITGNVVSLQGAWSGNPLGQAVALDFSFDESQLTETLNNGVLTDSAPITFASIVSGWGTGTNLEPNGPGTGSIDENTDTNTDIITETITTSTFAPHSGFTGDVFGISYFTDGVNTTLDVVRDAFVNGRHDSKNSGDVSLGNVNIGPITAQAPELDPSSAIGGLTLLLGGLAVMRGKKFARVPSA
jgi:hypothetical protein